MGYTPHVLVVGGGPLGTGLARDFAIRGLEVTLVDPGPLAAPRTGRMGGLLASGAQFARTDPGYARRCLAENRTLFEIASHCVEDTGGLLVGDDLDGLQAACEECSIAARRLSGPEAVEREPGLDPAVDGALAVPDAAVDPFLLTVATARDAREYGADIRPRTAVTGRSVQSGSRGARPSTCGGHVILLCHCRYSDTVISAGVTTTAKHPPQDGVSKILSVVALNRRRAPELSYMR